MQSKDPEGPKRTKKDPEGPKRTRKDPKGPGRNPRDPEGPKRTQKDSVKPSKQKQTGQAAFAASSFSSWLEFVQLFASMGSIY